MIEPLNGVCATLFSTLLDRLKLQMSYKIPSQGVNADICNSKLLFVLCNSMTHCTDPHETLKNDTSKEFKKFQQLHHTDVLDSVATVDAIQNCGEDVSRTCAYAAARNVGRIGHDAAGAFGIHGARVEIVRAVAEVA